MTEERISKQVGETLENLSYYTSTQEFLKKGIKQLKVVSESKLKELISDAVRQTLEAAKAEQPTIGETELQTLRERLKAVSMEKSSLENQCRELKEHVLRLSQELEKQKSFVGSLKGLPEELESLEGRMREAIQGITGREITSREDVVGLVDELSNRLRESFISLLDNLRGRLETPPREGSLFGGVLKPSQPKPIEETVKPAEPAKPREEKGPSLLSKLLQENLRLHRPKDS